jgi:hypothetical protein
MVGDTTSSIFALLIATNTYNVSTGLLARLKVPCSAAATLCTPNPCFPSCHLDLSEKRKSTDCEVIGHVTQTGMQPPPPRLETQCGFPFRSSLFPILQMPWHRIGTEVSTIIMLHSGGICGK